MVNVGKHTSPMDPVGMFDGRYIFKLWFSCWFSALHIESTLQPKSTHDSRQHQVFLVGNPNLKL